MPFQKKNFFLSAQTSYCKAFFGDASKFWRQNQGGTDNRVLTPSPSFNKVSSGNSRRKNDRPRAGRLNRATDKVTRAWGTLLMTDYFVW